MAERLTGFGARITFSTSTTVVFKEKSVTIPGLDGGDGVDTTTNANTAYKSATPQDLVALTNAAGTVTYDQATIAAIKAAINVIQNVTYTFNDGSKWVFEGWLKSFTPNEDSATEQPTAAIEIVATGEGGASDGIAYSAAT